MKTALEGVAGKTTGDAGFWSGTFRSANGDQFLALQFYLPTNKPAFSADTPLKFGGLVTDESGKEVDSFWEDATFAEVTEGTRKDRVFDRSVTLQPGSYKGTFGLFPAEGPAAVASSSISFKLEPKSTEFAVSPLILANGLVPLTKRPGPDGSVRLRNGQADQGRPQGRPHLLQGGQPLVLLQRREPDAARRCGGGRGRRSGALGDAGRRRRGSGSGRRRRRSRGS